MTLGCLRKADLTLVRPMLDYGCSIWDLHQLENVPRRAAKFVLGWYGKTDSVSEIIGELGWEILTERCKTIRFKNIHKIVVGMPSLKDLNNRL